MFVRAREAIARWLKRRIIKNLGGKCQKCGTSEGLMFFHDGLWCVECLRSEEPDFFEE